MIAPPECRFRLHPAAPPLSSEAYLNSLPAATHRWYPPPLCAKTAHFLYPFSLESAPFPGWALPSR